MSESRPSPNRLLRVLVPLAIVLAGVGIFYLYVVSSTGTSSSSSTKQAASAPSVDSTAPGMEAAQSGATGEPPPVDAGATASAPAADGAAAQPGAAAGGAVAAATSTGELLAKRFPAEILATLGHLTAENDGGTFQMELEFSPFGAGLSRLRLANHFEHADRQVHETIQQFVGLNGSDRIGATPMAAASVNIDGRDVDLSLDVADAGVTLWRQTGPGAFEAVIVERSAEGTEREVARITRTYVLRPKSYEFTIEQRFSNESGRVMNVSWSQYGPTDLPLGVIRYGGDVRRVRFGYVLPAKSDPDQIVLGKQYRLAHAGALEKATTSPTGAMVWPPTTLWPDDDSKEQQLTLAWAGMTSRYFAMAMHPVPAPGVDLAKPAGASKGFSIVERVDRLAIPAPYDPNATGHTSPGVMILRVTSPKMTVAAGAGVDLSMLVYAGPLSRAYVEAEPAGSFYGLAEMVIFTFGGPCAFCTFQPVALFLRWFLGFLHDHVLFDWALAIMVLVVCVRTSLHPVTRWSQLSMLRFSKQMQALAPKQKAIQEKYKNDPVKMREEVTKLMREGHVDYTAAARGCLPPLLQTPIWIALYAMIFFTFELRHEAAFYGVIQWMTSGRWSFLADLAEPDNFVNFRDAFNWNGFSIPLLSGLMGPIQGLNILPLLLGVVFYIQQKYMAPPSTNMTPEQEQQQKIMKVMMVVMFPVFMYNAPAALSLYFMVNSSLGILESKWIRAHADQLEKKHEALVAAGLVPATPYGRKDREAAKKAAKPGLFARMQGEIERRQKLIEEQQKQAGKKKK